MNTNNRRRGAVRRNAARADGGGRTSVMFWLILALGLAAAAGAVAWIVEQAGGR